MLEGAATRRVCRKAWHARLYLYAALAALSIASLAGGAVAQSSTDTPVPPAQTGTKPPDKKPASTDDTTNVTVTAQKPLNRIDRQVYDNTKDPDSQTGTAADALNKVPGVSVDPNGEVTLRGKSPQILINGKPSPMMSGDNRAAALLAMPSGSIASIEVINNPGAQFGNDSSGAGIINIVTRTSLPPGGTASLIAGITSKGGYSSNLFGQYHTGKFSFTGTLSLRQDSHNGNSGAVLDAFDPTGNLFRRSESVGRSTSTSRSVYSTNSLEYALSNADTLTGQFSYMRSASRSTYISDTSVYNGAGLATDIYSRTGASQYVFETQTLGANWDHTGQKPGETLKVDAQVSRSLNGGLSPVLSLYSLATVASNLDGTRTRFHNGSKADNERLSLDYTTPIGDDQLNAGLQVIRDGNTTHAESYGPDAAATVLTFNALFANQFIYSQTVSAAYLTYQKPFGLHWTVLGGLRAEAFALNADAATQDLTNHIAYTTYNPSLFATYVISEAAKIRLSYSHRLLRPTAYDYNPATILQSETSLSVGKANLKPQKTDSLEAGYEYSDKTTSYSLRGYYTHEDGMIVSVTSFVADPLNLGNLVTRTARLNAGTRDTVGTEFVLSRRFGRQWSLNANANLSNVDFQTPDFAGNPSVTGLAGRISLNYSTKSRNDTVQVSYNVSPKTLTGQGYRSGFSAAGLTYSHNLNRTLALVFGANDLLRTSKTTSLTDTRTIYAFNYRSVDAPVFTLSLRARFGGNVVMPKIAPVGVSMGRSPG
jgi:outer membrane receptor protein involved in Fe transport